MVAPLVEAWIEIIMELNVLHQRLSLLSWKRGLKYEDCTNIIMKDLVAPLVEAWIEIFSIDKSYTE